MARGKVDVVIESKVGLGGDIAALKIIVEEAGGKMSSIRGEEVKDELSVLATNSLLH